MTKTTNSNTPSSNQTNVPLIHHIHSSIGVLSIRRVPHLSNFCYVGNKHTYRRLEQSRIDRAFESEILND